MDLDENDDLLAAMTECAEQTASLPRPVFMEFSESMKRAATRRGAAFYRRRHPHAIKARAVNYRASGDKVRAEQVAKILEDQQGKCRYCGCGLGSDYHIDHIVPLARGGTNALSNLCASCPTCNLKKGTRSAEEVFGDQEGA